VSSSQDMVEVLGGLSREDREWILARLSAGAKANLLQMAERTPGGESPEQTLDGLEPARVAGALLDEPSWVIAMILKVRSWSWENAVSGALPPMLRLELGRLRGSLPPVSTAMRQLLIRTLQHRLLAGERNSERFEDLLDRAQTPETAA
jgi:hypothetical protein